MATARRFLEGRYGNGVEMSDPVRQGAWSRAYAFRLEGRALVVRFNSDRQPFDLDRAALRFAAPGLPLPEILEIGVADGGYYAISERCFGDFLEDLPVDRARAVLPSLLDTLDALRTADTSGSTGWGPWDEHGNGRFPGWSEYLLAVDGGTPEPFRDTRRRDPAGDEGAQRLFATGMRELQALARSCPTKREVVHSDLVHSNVFVAGMRIAGVIDWQCAMYGDHLWDLAWLIFCIPWAPGFASVGLRQRAFDRWRDAGVDLVDADLRLRCYKIRIGLSAIVYNTWRRDQPNLEAATRRLADVLG